MSPLTGYSDLEAARLDILQQITGLRDDDGCLICNTPPDLLHRRNISAGDHPKSQGCEAARLPHIRST